MTSFNWWPHKTRIPWIDYRTIFLTRAGSHSYGTNIETSDEDYRGVAIAPEESYLGIKAPFEQYESNGDGDDLVIYDFRKFVKLASQANPNILELLFTDKSDHMISPSWYTQSLLDMRDLFVTKRCRMTFSGYATAQLKKIKHNTEHSIPGSSRFERIEKFGYCTKNAMHLVRLLRMCREILETGEVKVKRSDAQELLAIRNGAWTLQELVQYAEQMDAELDDICTKSSLPNEPDIDRIDEMCTIIVRDYLS